VDTGTLNGHEGSIPFTRPNSLSGMENTNVSNEEQSTKLEITPKPSVTTAWRWRSKRMANRLLALSIMAMYAFSQFAKRSAAA
jgi:hypothetical protein